MTIIDPTKIPAGGDDEPDRPTATPDRATPGDNRAPTPSAGALAPLLPGWLTDRHQLLDTTRKTVLRGGHHTLWHGLRLPLYAARLAVYSPRGGWRVLRRERNDRIHRRVIRRGPAWTWWAGMAGGVAILGWVDRPVDKRITRPAGELAGNPGPLRAPLVMQALYDIGIGRMRDPATIRLVFDVARQGPGYFVSFELPPGCTAVQVMEKREELAAALRREIGTVWPSKGVRHPGHLALYVSDQPMNSAKQTPWPRLKAGAVGVFRPTPLFTDQQGGLIREGLHEVRPGIHGALDNNGLGRLLRAAGVRVASVHVTDRGSHKGVRREWLDVAVTDMIGDDPEGEEGARGLTGDDQT